MRQDLAPGIDQDEQDHDRDDADRRARGSRCTGRPADAPRTQVARASLVAPDQGAMEEQRHEQQVERVHLGEGRLLPDGPGEREAEGGGHRDHGSDAEPDRDQDGDADGRGGRRRRQEIGPPGERLIRDQAEQLADQRVERIAGRVEDAEARQQQLGLGPVTEADTGEQRPDVDDRGDRERGDGGQARRADPCADAVERRGGCLERRRDGHREPVLLRANGPRLARRGMMRPRRWLLDRWLRFRHGRGTPVNQAGPWLVGRASGEE